MKSIKNILAIITAFLLGSLLFWQLIRPTEPVFIRSSVPLFKALGIGPQALDNLFTRVLPITDLDEEQWGLLFRESYTEDPYPIDSDYLNHLIEKLDKLFARKDFQYQVFILDSQRANAFAAPGGNILVTQGLLKTLKTEGEIVAVLLHEMAHIERDHCLALIRTVLLEEKYEYLSALGAVDLLFSVFLEPGFSKTQEDEADRWALQRMGEAGYHPMALPVALGRLIDFRSPPNLVEHNPIRDYFLTHPDLELRVESFRSLAPGIMPNYPQGLLVGQWAYEQRRKAPHPNDILMLDYPDLTVEGEVFDF